jgi:hypothetical protein
MPNKTDGRERTESLFNRRQRAAEEGSKARDEYEASRRAADEKTVRLRALRLAKEAADQVAHAEKEAEKAKAKRTTPRAKKAK